MNKLWFLGGFIAMAAVTLVGIKIASAAFTPTTTQTVKPAQASCGCSGKTASCQGGCNMGANKTCGCHNGATGGSCGQK